MSKATLDIAIYDSPKKWQFANDDAGIGKVVEFLSEAAPALVVMESTGGFRYTRISSDSIWYCSSCSKRLDRDT